MFWMECGKMNMIKPQNLKNVGYTNLYIKNLEQSVTEDTLWEMFSPFGNITSLVVLRDFNGNSKGFGFVNFEKPEEAKNAEHSLHQTQLGSKVLYVARAQNKLEREIELQEERKQIQQHQGLNNVYVKHINEDVDEDRLKNYFEQYGEVISVKIMRNKKGTSRGFGFVCFSNPLEAEQAIRYLNGLEFDGKPLYVSKAPKIVEIIWVPPPSGWVKVNTDGSTHGCPGVSGAAGIFRTSEGFVKGCFAIPLGISYAFEAELAAAIHAITYAWNKEWHNLWLETDSTHLVWLCHSKSVLVPWRWRAKWQQCLDYMSQMNFHVTHIFREGNAAADLLASWAPGLQCPIWWHSTPSFLKSSINKDACGCPSYRFKSQYL